MSADDIAALKAAVQGLKDSQELTALWIEGLEQKMDARLDDGFGQLGQVVENLISEVRADRQEFRQRLEALENANHDKA